MHKLFFELLHGKFDNQRKRAYQANLNMYSQLHFKNGEVIKLDGYSTHSNHISRTSSIITILLLGPLQILKNNGIYFTLSVISLIIISSLWTLDSLIFEFYFIITLQYIAYLLVEFFNKFNLSKLDQKLNQQEVKLLKQWDECISNKEILKRIKEKANQKPKGDEIKERDRKPSSAKNEQHALYLRQLSQKSRSSGSIILPLSVQSQMSRQSVALQAQNRPAQSPNPHLDRMGSRVSLMSPLIHEDMILKNELKQKLIQDPAISKFMGQVPSMFDKVTVRSKKLIETKMVKNADKMDLIKSITSEEIQLGDVIIVERNQIAQCDILVLHCNDENFTVQQQLCCYSGVSIRKPLNQNRYDSHNLVLFKKAFTGTIQLTENPEIRGYFQLKKDPQSKIISEENVLFASEKLLNTPWVIGVVIKVGLKCRCYSKFKIKQQQPNYSQKLLTIIIFIFFSLLILMYIVVYQNQYLQEYRSLIEIIAKNLMQLLFILPHSFRLYYSILSLFQQNILTRIGELDIKQIRAFHLEEYNDAKRITMNLDSLIDGTFELRTIICKSRICYCKEIDFVKQASILAPQSSHNIFRTVDSKDDSKITELQKQNLNSNTSRYGDELGSLDEEDESAGIVPQINGLRLISNFNSGENTQPDAVNLISHGQLGGQSESLGKTKIQYSKGSKQYSMKDSKVERKSIFVNDLIKMINGNDEELFNSTLIQFCLNQVSYSKLMYTQTGEEKVKNTHMNQLDDKQIQIAKSFGYEFVCVNNVQNSLIYIVQIGFKLFNFKLVDTQLHHHSQRLYMLFELDPEFQNQNNQFILFIRESNFKKNEVYEDKVSQKSSLHIVHQEEFDSIHQIHYYSCFLNAEDAAFYINQQSLQQSSIENEQFMYHTLEPLLQLNIVLGFKYIFRPKAQEFLNNIEKSKYQLLLYTEQYSSFSLSIISSSDISHHSKFFFEQDNDDDLRAYFKKTLQQVSQMQLDQSLATDSKASLSKLAIPNPSQLSNTKRVYEEYHAPTPITVVLNSTTCKMIENHSYMKNHLKLIFRLAKTVVLFNADQPSLDLVQNLLDQPQQSLNLLFENQSILRCYEGQHLQIALLQEFSYFQKVKYENVNKQTFFKNMIASLKVRLIYERCIFNELLIFHNSDAILQSFNEVNELLFYYTPIMTILSRQTLEIAFQRTIFFAAFCIIIHMVNLQTTVDELDLTFELGFFSYIYSLLIYIISTIHFVHQNKANQQDSQQTLIHKALINQNKDRELYFFLAFKCKNSIMLAIFQGVITALIFSYNDPSIQYEVIIVYTFLSISLYDAFKYTYLVRMKLKLWSALSFSILYFFYLLLHFNVTVQNTYFQFQVNLLFEIFLVFAMLLTFDTIMERPFMYNIPKIDTKLNQLFVQLIGERQPSQRTFSALSQHVNKIFDNIEQVDISIQKLLLNQKILAQNLGQWQSQIFQKAQSIMKWKKKSTIQGLQLIAFHCQMLIIIYVPSNTNYYFLIIYIIYLIFQIIIFVFQQISKLSSRQMQYLELVKFMTSGLATLMALLGLLMNGMSSSYNLFTQILVVFQVSSKLHPIYDNRLYLIPLVVVLIVYFIIIAIQIEVTPYFMIIMIAMIFLFSVQQYIIKSYFILLEENQATNQINFIEENNKINDILGILLPKFVRHRLNETDEYNIHQNQGHVAIVFCDICNFDQIIMEEQKNIIQFLDDLFRTFDKYCEICGVQKIETVGKTYMASAGLKACEQDLAYLSEIHPVQRALNLAEMMINYIRTKLWGNEGKILIGKIGIHYGRAISGVIGFHKPQFSLIGDTVNTTSRVCSTGLEDKIILSEQAFEQLNNDKIEFTVRYVEMKGLGQRPTYIFVQKLGETKPTIPHRTSLTGSNGGSRQNTINYQNRVRTISQQKGGLKKRQSFIQQQSLKQITTSQLTNQFQFQSQFSHNQKLIQESGSKTNTIQFSSQIQQQIMRKESIDNENEQAKKPDLLKKLATILQHKFQLEEYQPEVDHYIDYDQLLNVILLKNENKFEDTVILESSFIQLLKKSYSQNQNKYLEYHEFIYNQSEVVTNKIMQVYTLYYLIKQFCLIAEYNSIPLALIILQWIGCAQNIISIMIYNKKFLNYWIFLIQIELSYQLLIGGLFQIMDINEFLTNIHLIEMIFIQSFFSNIQLLHFWIKIVFCACSFIFELIILAFAEDYRISIFFVIMIFVYNVNYCYFLEEQQVSCFNQKNVFQVQQAKESQLLQYLLPKHILQTFFDDNNRTSQQCDEIENITILFADIAGFTEYSSKVSPEQVLLMLKNLFVEFDRQCYELNVYKLYTIGDCYVAFGMIDYNDRNPSEEAKNIVDLAFEMIRIIEIVRKQINFEGLDMRIGIHTGSVFGGVMGTDIVRYDIYGPDVLIANKMESNGKKGCVQVSAKTKELLEQDYEDKYDFSLHTKVTLQAINQSIEGFLVEKLADDDFQSDQVMSQAIQVQSLHSD